MTANIEAIISQIETWKDAKNIQVEPLAGLTNANYAVTVDGERFALRISGGNTAHLGIDRDNEIAALTAASAAGIAPELIAYLPPEGHLVTRFIEGDHLSLEEYRRPENLRRIIDKVKQLHNLPAIQVEYNPFRRVENYAQHAQLMGISLPPDFDRFAARMAHIKKEQTADTSAWRRFCHNDLFCVNVIDGEKIWLIDWEFSGMNDLYFDLATLTYAYDSPETLTPELTETLLECYFGEVGEQHRTRLAGMQYMVMFFCAMWGLLQQGMLNAGKISPIEGFSFMEYANENFESMRKVSHR